jgi:hypothetical protein
MLRHLLTKLQCHGPVSGLRDDGEVDVVAENEAPARNVPTERVETRGQQLVRHMRGRGDAKETAHLSTDELIELLRGR